LTDTRLYPSASRVLRDVRACDPGSNKCIRRNTRKRAGAQKVFLTKSDGAGLGSANIISSTFHTLSLLV